MLLNNVSLRGRGSGLNIRTEGCHVAGITVEQARDSEKQIFFEGALAFPGLINSHDHLDFNLFPQLGDMKYRNYTQWGKYIHQNYKSEIKQVLNVPLPLREEWGIIKNLISGVTTVVNHGERIKLTRPLINVHEKYHCLHSAGFEKNWRLKLNHPLKRRLPYVIHAGEGTDDLSTKEIDSLIKWNVFGKPLIGVHGVAMSPAQASRFKALVWCPQSNRYLLDRHAPIDRLKSATKILFGTDSTLTAHWDIWEHIREARGLGLLNDEELYHSLTEGAAREWGINSGQIAANKEADIIVVRNRNNHGDPDAFFAVRPADILLVMQGGEVRLFDEELWPQMRPAADFSSVYINGVCKYVQGDVAQLVKHIKKYYPGVSLPVEVD